MELFEAASNDLGMNPTELVERWKQPYHIVKDIFQVKDIYGKLIPYQPYPYLIDFLNSGFNEIAKDRCVLKSRQLGFST